MLPETVSCRIDSKIFSRLSHYGEIHSLYRLWVYPDGTGKVEGSVSDEQFQTIMDYDLQLLVVADTQRIHCDDDLETVKTTSVNVENRSFTWTKIPYTHR